ncbi:MAG: hypothetical protein JSU63_13090 [Phycisphaerales bacterium]|nr:MAG: hypothetical protein JSU63_13090 [Phycisphaerales bacterium]
MATGRLRRYDVQATYACVLAIVSVAPFAAAVWLILRNLNRDLRQVIYSAEGLFEPVFLGCILVSIAPAAIAFLLGWSSAGQRRNDKPGRSWLGFFLGGSIVTFDVVLAIAFFMLQLKQGS